MKKIRFDSRSKKPTLYPLLIPTAAAVIAVTLMLRINPKGLAPAICAVTATLALGVSVTLLFAFRRQLEYNPYSYNTIYYTGFAIFTFFIFVTHVSLLITLLASPGVYDAEAVLHLLLNSAKQYMYVTSPFLLAFSAALCVSNISLIRREGRRPVNLLGIVLSFLLVGGEVFVFTFDYAASGSQTEVMIHDLFANLAAAIFLYFECMIFGTIIAGAIAARREPEYDPDFIVILGCGLKKDGTPTPLLRGRVDRALGFAELEEETTGKKPVFVTSGGKGTEERNSESEAMKNYLISQGVPEDRIIGEDRSRDTFENMKFSKAKIEEAGGGKVAFSTTNYHVFRSGILARRVGMKAVGMGAKTKWYFWPNAAVRELASLLVSHRGKQALILGSLVAAYVVLTLLAYR